MDMSEVIDLSHEPGLRHSPLQVMLLKLASRRRMRRLSVRFASRLEGGVFYSATARMILAKHFGVRVGAYSYGECMIPGAFPSGVTFGRYVSVAAGVRAFLRNHPPDRPSLHPFFFNSRLGYIAQDNVAFGTLEIAHDAWLGYRAMLTPGCHRIGVGAIVAAGAVVTKDVPDFGIVAGSPARLVRMRFPPDLCTRILESRWWELPIEALRPVMARFGEPLRDGGWLRELRSIPADALADPASRPALDCLVNPPNPPSTH